MSNNQDASLVNMFSLSETMPQLRTEIISRDQYLDLMDNSMDEGFVFSYTDIISEAISKNVQTRLSREQQRVLFDKLEEVVKRKLPMIEGIQHRGYLISCMAMINGRRSNCRNKSEDLIKEIEAVPNLADQAFLYAHVAEYLPKAGEKAEFIEKAVKITESLDYMFDKMNRYDYCLQEAFLAAKSRAQGIATKVMTSLLSNLNGSYEDYQRMLDMVRDHDEQLADTLLEMVDDDPARVQYKKRLQSRANTTKKLKAAKNDLSQVARLNNDEQIQFFERQMEYLIKKKNVVRDVTLTQSILSQIYNNPITDTQNAVLFFMENLYEKNQTNHKYNTLLREMHRAVVNNLQLVLAIAAGTKDKLERVNRIMEEQENLRRTTRIIITCPDMYLVSIR